MPNHRPWYEDWEAQCERAKAFIIAYCIDDRRIDDDEKLPNFPAEIDAFEDFTFMKLIYESNRLEKAGLSESDTKKLLQEDEAFSDPGKTISLCKTEIKTFDDLLKAFKTEASAAKAPRSIFVFQEKERTEEEVRRHYRAISYALHVLLERNKNEFLRVIPKSYMSRKNADSQAPALKEIWRNQSDRPLDIPLKPIGFFSSKDIRRLHFLMARGLLPRDARVEAGFWRIDNRTTDFQTAFPAPENIPKAMELFIRNANHLMESFRTLWFSLYFQIGQNASELMASNENPVLNAARISYDFVAIHPFPDFNGRLSRLIMNMVLRAYGLRFYAVLRGSAKEKHRYLTALRHANRGKISSYACLIARAVNDGFDQLNTNLKKAGLRPIGD